jgi:hypothetical protein
MAVKKAPAKVRSVYEREPGSGIWWIRYEAEGKPKRKKSVVGPTQSRFSERLFSGWLVRLAFAKAALRPPCHPIQG